MVVHLLLQALLFTVISTVSAQNPPCEICGCSFCPPGFEVGSPSGTIPIPPEFADQAPPGFTEIPCSLLDFAGSSGQIPPDLCNDDLRLLPEFRATCGCPPVPGAVPTIPSPVAPPPSPPSTRVPTKQNEEIDCFRTGEKEEKPPRVECPSAFPSSAPSILPSAIPSPKKLPCAFIALVMDESFSMGPEQQAMAPIMEGINNMLRKNFLVFFCSFGFGRFSSSSGRRLDAAAPNVKGCSLGFDPDDYRFERTGSVQDGWEAIVFADTFFSGLVSIDGVEFDSQCLSTNKWMLLVTDEARDTRDSLLTQQHVHHALSAGGWTLSAMLNLQLNPLAAVGAKNDGNGTFTGVLSLAGAPYTFFTTPQSPIVSGLQNTQEDYVPLVDSTGGYVWAINAIRRGGDGAKAVIEAVVNTTLEIYEEE